MTTPETKLAPGAYKFTVNSADEAVTLIRERLGAEARVLSVRAVPSKGWRKIFRAPRLEVVAQIDAPVPANGLSLTVAPRLAAEPDSITSTRPAPPPLRGEDSPVGLAGLLRRSGLTESALNRLQAGANWSELDHLPLHRALAETSRLLRAQVESRPVRATISRAAFFGTPGVGRTTALCKWLAVEVFRRSRVGHVVTVEFDRATSPGSLPVYTEAMGVPLAHFPCDTHPAIPGGFVYFDLPGMSSRRVHENQPLANFLDREAINERVLVLNAAYDRASLREAYSAGRDLGATHLVFTHLDEVPQWGKLWDYLFDESIEPLFLATGPSLTGDCEEDVPGAIVRRTLPERFD